MMFSVPKDKAITGKARESLLAGVLFSSIFAEIDAFRVLFKDIECFSLLLETFNAIFNTFFWLLTRESVVTGLKLLSVEQILMPSKIDVFPALFWPTIKLILGPGAKDTKSSDLRFAAE